jgi:molecular chaperone GrpE
MSDIEEAVQEQEPVEAEGVSSAETPCPADGATPGAGSPTTGAGGPDGATAGAGSPDVDTKRTPGAQPSSPTEAGEENEIEDDLDQLVKVGAQRDEYLALAQRTQADFENYRKRVARDAAAAQERGVAKLAREQLPALDNLDRALDAAAAEDPLLEGVRLVRSELAAALARVGIESFSPAGEPFDPEQHEAIVQRPVEGAEPGSVAEVYQAGYRLNGTIIRPARVVVAA